MPVKAGANQRRASQKRESQAVKKTQIEVLDHETPIEEYQQMYYQNEQVDPEEPYRPGGAMATGPHTESADLFNNMYANVTTNEVLTNHEHVRHVFKLDQIKDEEDLHNYKNLLNAMGAIYYTDHGMKGRLAGAFSAWLQLARSHRGNMKKEPSRAVPDIQIDTDLANKEYEDFNNNGDLAANNADQESTFSLPSNIDPADKDQVQDFLVQRYLRDLQKVGIHSKQILNYSYPPLLYQRGDDSEDNGADGEDEQSQEESAEEELSHAHFGEDLDVGDLLGRELGLDDSEENADLRQQNNAQPDAEIEQMVDGFFSKGHEGEDPMIGHADSGDGMIDGVNVSEIQRMINKSGESDGSPGLDRFN